MKNLEIKKIELLKKAVETIAAAPVSPEMEYEQLCRVRRIAEIETEEAVGVYALALKGLQVEILEKMNSIEFYDKSLMADVIKGGYWDGFIDHSDLFWSHADTYMVAVSEINEAFGRETYSPIYDEEDIFFISEYRRVFPEIYPPKKDKKKDLELGQGGYDFPLEGFGAIEDDGIPF